MRIRISFDEADLVKILSKHLGMSLTLDNISINTNPFEIEVEGGEELPVTAVAPKKTTVAEELQQILATAAQQVVTETGTQKEVTMAAPEETPPSATTFSMDQLLDPTVSRHTSAEDALQRKVHEPMPPLPKLNDYFDSVDGNENEHVHYDDPGETTQAEIDAARRQKRGM